MQQQSGCGIDVPAGVVRRAFLGPRMCPGACPGYVAGGRRGQATLGAVRGVPAAACWVPPSPADPLPEVGPLGLEGEDGLRPAAGGRHSQLQVPQAAAAQERHWRRSTARCLGEASASRAVAVPPVWWVPSAAVPKQGCPLGGACCV